MSDVLHSRNCSTFSRILLLPTIPWIPNRALMALSLFKFSAQSSPKKNKNFELQANHNGPEIWTRQIKTKGPKHRFFCHSNKIGQVFTHTVRNKQDQFLRPSRQTKGPKQHLIRCLRWVRVTFSLASFCTNYVSALSISRSLKVVTFGQKSKKKKGKGKEV